MNLGTTPKGPHHTLPQHLIKRVGLIASWRGGDLGNLETNCSYAPAPTQNDGRTCLHEEGGSQRANYSQQEFIFTFSCDTKARPTTYAFGDKIHNLYPRKPHMKDRGEVMPSVHVTVILRTCTCMCLHWDCNTLLLYAFEYSSAVSNLKSRKKLNDHCLTYS